MSNWKGELAAVLKKENEYLLYQRSNEAIQNGLWDFPSLICTCSDDLEKRLHDLVSIQLGVSYFQKEENLLAYSDNNRGIIIFIPVELDGPAGVFNEHYKWIKVDGMKSLDMAPGAKFYIEEHSSMGWGREWA